MFVRFLITIAIALFTFVANADNLRVVDTQLETIRQKAAKLADIKVLATSSYFEMQYYSDASCTNMILTNAFKAQKCVAISESTYYGKYSLASSTSTSATVQVKIYSDSKCSTSAYVTSATYETVPLTCTPSGSGSYYKASISSGVSTLTPGSGISGAYIATYTTPAHCKANTMKVPAYISSYQFFPIGFCISGTSLSDSDSEYDVMMTDCSGKSSSFEIFTSTDGSCSGDVTEATFKQRQYCNEVGDIYDMTYGYINFKCTA